ncbi:MAG: hypothetical protein HLUCCA12_15125 [Rhodobacteraceae bacterium HLUCCA12]|nr:MAG: hypothetical protein HLUCCA12_15125 [Rhodobacteraceae bacterium HLUCCA12]
MCIWISRIRLTALSLVAGLSLAACFESVSLSQATDRETQAPSGPASVSVLDDEVTVVGPAGYCVDDTATRESENEAFVLLVRCSPTRRNSPILSATVTSLPAQGEIDPDSLERLGDFLQTAAGRAQLARRGNAGDVALEAPQVADGALWLRIEDRGNPETFEAGYWRAIMPLAGRVVTLSVLSARDHPVGSDRSLTALRAFVAAMRRTNAD